MKNLKELMISISDVKCQLSDIIKNKLTKIIVKNNEPVAVIMPYSKYTDNLERLEESNNLLNRLGQDITLDNGVQVMVSVVKEDDGLCVRTYVKMKTSGDYKLFFTHHLGMPSIESSLTTDEIMEYYKLNADNKKS